MPIKRIITKGWVRVNAYTDDQNVWIMLHSGSRGIGNQIGRYFISPRKSLITGCPYKCDWYKM